MPMADILRRRVRARGPRRLVLLLAVATAALVTAVGCGGEGSDEAIPETARDAGPVHVHGLGVNPGDSALYVATHTGLFRIERGSDRLERVGDSSHDMMGFAVAGRDRFLVSGHPDLRDELPSLLGLMESTDAGRSWRSVSLLGEADFHALRVSGPRVVGYDASQGRLMTSTDAGRTWHEERPPAPLADVVVHPGRPSHLVAAAEAGLVGSRDGGTTWSPLGGASAIALAWPRDDRLYAWGPDGEVRVSRDAGGSWSRAGDVGGEPAAVAALDARRLVVALHDGGLASSADGGRTWAPGPWPS
jgi:photosystem II stability/assembly factor-like uncharacterized protein